MYPFSTGHPGDSTDQQRKEDLNFDLFYYTYQCKCYALEKAGSTFPLKGRSRFHVLKYIFKLHSNFGHGLLHSAESLFNKLISEAIHPPVTKEEMRSAETDDEIIDKFVATIMPDVHKFFILPNQQPISESHQNEVLISYLDFLLQILYVGASRATTEHQSCSHVDIHRKSYAEQIYKLLQNELTFLFTLLGDTPFQFPEFDEVKNILAQIESVAIEVGSLIYFCVFDEFNHISLDERRDAMLEKIALLKVNIRDHCIIFTQLQLSFATHESTTTNFLFNVYSFVEDLEDLINHRLELIGDGMVDQIKSIQEELKFSLSLLKSIEAMSKDTDQDELKQTLAENIDVSYQAEYLINSHVEGYLPMWYVNLRLPCVISKIKGTRRRLQEINNSNARCVGFSSLCREASYRSVEAPVNDFLVGYENNKVNILGDLIGGSKSLKIIFIVGMPGLGKTAIVKKLYDDRAIHDHFDRCGWCVGSEKYDRRRMLIEILETITIIPKNDPILKGNDETLGLEIHKTLFGRRYFIVVDDIWESSAFDDLRKYFPDNTNGSRILLTSRIKSVAPPGSIFHSLPLLSETQCWELLEKKVFLKQHCPPELLEIGKELATNCRGLPLALVVTAGILSVEKKESAWKKVKNQLGLHLDDSEHYRKTLEVSYENLPIHLKPCFLYLGAFLKDSDIDVRNLMCMWIAEGFVEKIENKNVESVAEEYLVDLISRSLLVISRRRSDGGIKSCTFHDLLKDLCMKRAHEENFMKCINGDDFSFFEKRKHVCVNSTSTTWRNIGQHCRSFVGYLSETTSTSHFSRMPLLRVMAVQLRERIEFQERDKQIDVPTHLRYVCCQAPRFVKGNFTNLEYLYIIIPFGSYKISPIILKMVKLRKLRIKMKATFTEDCDISQRTQLEYLSELFIYSDKGVKILNGSPHLRRLKCHFNGIVFPDLCSLSKLESLTMYLNEPFFTTNKRIDPTFPSTIKKLHLRGMNRPWEKISVVGRLPNLQVLKLEGEPFRGEEWNTTEGEFLELKFLKFIFLYKGLRWNTYCEHFPKLERLVLEKCGKSLEISSDFGDHPTLETIEVRYCTEEIKESAALIGNEQLKNGNMEFKVIISGSSDESMIQEPEIDTESDEDLTDTVTSFRKLRALFNKV